MAVYCSVQLHFAIQLVANSSHGGCVLPTCIDSRAILRWHPRDPCHCLHSRCQLGCSSWLLIGKGTSLCLRLLAASLLRAYSEARFTAGEAVPLKNGDVILFGTDSQLKVQVCALPRASITYSGRAGLSYASSNRALCISRAFAGMLAACVLGTLPLILFHSLPLPFPSTAYPHPGCKCRQSLLSNVNRSRGRWTRR